jgi:hypothetical protein
VLQLEQELALLAVVGRETTLVVDNREPVAVVLKTFI